MWRWPWAPVEAACLLMGGAGCPPFGCFGLRRPGAGACRLLVGPGLRDQGPKMSASSIYDPRESRRRPLPPEETLQDPQVGRAQAAVQSCRCHARELACALRSGVSSSTPSCGAPAMEPHRPSQPNALPMPDPPGCGASHGAPRSRGGEALRC